MRIGLLCLYLGFLIAVLIGLVVTPPSKPAESIYNHRDTIQFCDRETGDPQKTIKNAEFRLLSKNDVIYSVKIEKNGQEVLVMEKIPENCFPVITKK